MATFHLDFGNSFFQFQMVYRNTFSFSFGIKKLNQKFGWKSFGWNRGKDWWKFQQATPI